MSSYSEYLARTQQRLQKFIDTRPHRDAGHHTEVIKRLAAAGVQETRNPVVSGNMVLDGPSTRVLSPYKKGHTVQDTSVYNSFTAGQAVAQSSTLANTKAPQIEVTCYSSTVVPEYNDKLRTNTDLAAKQAAKNALRGNCCTLCGKPPIFDSGCGCSLTAAQLVSLPTSGGKPRVPS